MFKAQIASRAFRRGFSFFRRGPSNSSIIRRAARDGQETVRIQRVYFNKRFITTPRLIGTVIATGGAYALLLWFDGLLDEVELDEEGEKAARPRKSEGENATGGREITDAEEEDEDDEEEEEEEEEALIFIPTGFSRPKPRTFYRGSDPEWQEFVKIAPDRERLDRIRGELVSIIRKLPVLAAKYRKRVGDINHHKGNSWIDVRFPDGPPIEYERPGYELTDALNIRMTTRDVHELHHQRMQNLLVPSAVAKSVYQDSKRRAENWWQDFKKFMGWQDKPNIDTAQKLLTKFRAIPPSAPKAPTVSTTPPSSTTPPLASSTSSETEKQSTSSSDPLSKNAYERFGLALPDPAKAPTLDLSHFRRIFRQNNQHRPLQRTPPRGSIIVTGLIEVVGDRAKMTLDVAAAYDPQTNKYVMINAKVRHIVDYQQRPKGGP